MSGELSIHGAKNSALPLLAAAILCQGKTVIHNCPDLSDVDAAFRILRHLGCGVRRENDMVVIDAESIETSEIPTTLMREMRSSIVFLGAIAARTGRAKLSFPGGCELGPRPIDLHLAALKKLGLTIEEDHGFLDCRSDVPLRGADVIFSISSVGATENVMLAASLAKGTTTIHNAAREPEICDLAAFLNACGADIRGAGESIVEIRGVKTLTGCEYTVMPDRIAAATYMAAAAVTGGELDLLNVVPEHVKPIVPVFEEAGCRLRFWGNNLTIQAPARLSSMHHVVTGVFPGFPTDAQPTTMAMAAVARGNSMFVETIFENRFKQVGELARLGAKIKVDGRVAVVEGVEKLSGAPVMATDLRGGASLVIAALAAEGTTSIDEIHHIDRGYERMEETLCAVGADIQRV